MAPQRRQQIIDAFIRLIAQRGLEQVTLDEVANEAGMQRSALRHFLGNRQELIAATVEELTRRYGESVFGGIGQQPHIDAVIDLLFGRRWASDPTVEDRAFDVLVQEAARNDDTRTHIRHAYDLLLEEVGSALERSHPDATSAAIKDTAYCIVCLVEHNVFMQQLGYPKRRGMAAHAAARRLVKALDA